MLSGFGTDRLHEDAKWATAYGTMGSGPHTPVSFRSHLQSPKPNPAEKGKKTKDGEEYGFLFKAFMDEPRRDNSIPDIARHNEAEITMINPKAITIVK